MLLLTKLPWELEWTPRLPPIARRVMQLAPSDTAETGATTEGGTLHVDRAVVKAR